MVLIFFFAFLGKNGPLPSFPFQAQPYPHEPWIEYTCNLPLTQAPVVLEKNFEKCQQFKNVMLPKSLPLKEGLGIAFLFKK